MDLFKAPAHGIPAGETVTCRKLKDENGEVDFDGTETIDVTNPTSKTICADAHRHGKAENGNVVEECPRGIEPETQPEESVIENDKAVVDAEETVIGD